MKRILKMSMYLAMAGTMAVSSCKKDEDPDTDADVASAQENNAAEGIFNDAFSSTMDGANSNEGAGVRETADLIILTGCATITVKDSSNAKQMIIDFGTTGCLGKDGRSRKGRIYAAFTGRISQPGSKVDITFDNFYTTTLKDPAVYYKVEGKKEVTNITSSGGNPKFQIVVTDGKVTHPNGSVSYWACNRTREQTMGSSTPLILADDEYKLDGSANGTTTTGTKYEVIVKESLMVPLACRYITKGVLELTPEGKLTRSINYGDGTCDAKATVTIGGISYDIVMY